MKNKRSFEDILKSKIDGLEQIPPDRLGMQLKNRLEAKEATDFQWQKILLWTIGSLLLAWAGFQYFKAAPSKIPAQPVEELQYANRLDSQQFHEEKGHGHSHISQKETKILVTQTPDGIKNIPYINARLQAKAEQKMIFIHAFNMDCSHCQKMKEITLANQEVQAFLKEHFVTIDIDMQLEKNFDIIRFYDIKTSPTFLFLNGQGQIVNMAYGFNKPEKFIATLEKAMEEEAEGSYLDLKSRKRVNPTPNQLKKTHPLNKVSLPDNLMMEAATANQLILINVFEKGCPNCERLKTITFRDEKVQKLVDTRFYRWTINSRQAKELGLLQATHKISIPTTFIFSNTGIWLTKFEGFMSPKPFVKTLQQSLKRNAALHKGIQLLTAKVFPNPTKGPFKVAMKGQVAPLSVKIIDLQGKIILEQTKREFTGQQEYDFDLTGQHGQLFIQFSQGKSMIYKKLIVL